MVTPERSSSEPLAPHHLLGLLGGEPLVEVALELLIVLGRVGVLLDVVRVVFVVCHSLVVLVPVVAPAKISAVLSPVVIVVGIDLIKIFTLRSRRVIEAVIEGTFYKLTVSHALVEILLVLVVKTCSAAVSLRWVNRLLRATIVHLVNLAVIEIAIILSKVTHLVSTLKLLTIIGGISIIIHISTLNKIN